MGIGRKSMSPYKVEHLKSPITLPEDSATSERWQYRNRMWWDTQPMRYDHREKILAEPGSPEYFNEIDGRFFGAVRQFMPWKHIPFDPLIDFQSLAFKDVLEVGVGYGSHAALLAPSSRSFTGIDLTHGACVMTKRRFELLNLRADILRMDAEHMSLRDESFDYIWSWGVIHHSANPVRMIHEIYRTLRPGGEAVIMVYHRSFWKYFVEAGLARGVFRGDWFRFGSLSGIVQAASDGAMARFYTREEWCELCRGLFEVSQVQFFGQKTDLFLIPHGTLKNFVIRLVPDRVTRFISNTLGFGSFLVARMRKI